MPPSRFTVPIRPATSGTPPSRPTAPISPCGPPCLQLPSSPAASGTMPLPASAPGAAGPGRAHGGRSAPCRPPHRGSGKWCSQGTVLPPLRGEAGLWRAGEQQRDGAALAAAEASKFTGQERFGKEKGFEPLQSQRVYLSPSENQQERSCSRAVCSASFCANPFSYRYPKDRWWLNSEQLAQGSPQQSVQNPLLGDNRRDETHLKPSSPVPEEERWLAATSTLSEPR
ncbi:uncharacterized protein LOC107204250 isoform X3 [Parus major]|uniref:uncharacterized protein LOC107204250 isoform X3 n=1 Tax=Parus major TaxID=9157 RepID=UPI0008F4D5D3|nr:uncharacterized protein LOC107204250 isoform X3 [Parus major]